LEEKAKEVNRREGRESESGRRETFGDIEEAQEAERAGRRGK